MEGDGKHTSPTTPPPSGTGFLDLPAELRIWVYEAVLAPVLQVADDPWAQFPPWSRFEVVSALALTSRQVGAEATSLFYKKLARRVRFYFDDIVRLYEFQAWAKQREGLLRQMRFVLRIDGEGSAMRTGFFGWEIDGYYPIPQTRVDGERLIHCQTGWNPAWLKLHNWASTNYWGEPPSDIFRFPLPSMVNGRLMDQLHPDCRLEKCYHRSDGPASGIGRHNSLTWPPLQGSLLLTTYVCMDSDCVRYTRPDYAPAYHSTMVELEGELRDIDWSTFPIDNIRTRRYHKSRRFFDGYMYDWGGWSDAEWRDDPPESDIDSWAPSSWYASDTESYIDTIHGIDANEGDDGQSVESS